MGVGTMTLPVAEALNLLKIQYGSKIVSQINDNFKEILGMLQSFGPEKRIGYQWQIPIKTGMSDNIGFSGSTYQLPATGGAPSYSNIYETHKWLHGTFQLDIEVLTRMRQGQEQAYAEAASLIQDDLKDAITQRRGVQFFAGKSGKVARLAAAYNAGDNIAVTGLKVDTPLGWSKGDESTALGFKEDYMKVVFPIGTRILIDSVADELLVVTGYKSSGGDADLDTLLCKTSPGGLLVLGQNHADNDWIYYATSTSLISNANTNGLVDLFDQTAGTAYMGLKAADAPKWNAQLVTGSTAGTEEDLDTSHLRRSLITCENEVGEIPDLWIANTHMLGAFEMLAESNTRFNPQQSALGMEQIDYVLPGGRRIKKFLWTRFCPPGMIFGLNTKNMIHFNLMGGEFDDTNGNMLHRIEGYDVFEGVWRQAENFGTNKRASHVVIKDLKVV